jgi:hypothetical protein
MMEKGIAERLNEILHTCELFSLPNEKMHPSPNDAPIKPHALNFFIV